MTPSGIEPATFRFVAQHLNHCATAVLLVNVIHKLKPFTGRPAGRPNSRWEDDVRNGLKNMKLVKWAEQVQGRLKWKDVVGKAKTVSEL